MALQTEVYDSGEDYFTDAVSGDTFTAADRGDGPLFEGAGWVGVSYARSVVDDGLSKGLLGLGAYRLRPAAEVTLGLSENQVLVQSDIDAVDFAVHSSDSRLSTELESYYVVLRVTAGRPLLGSYKFSYDNVAANTVIATSAFAKIDDATDGTYDYYVLFLSDGMTPRHFQPSASQRPVEMFFDQDPWETDQIFADPETGLSAVVAMAAGGVFTGQVVLDVARPQNADGSDEVPAMYAFWMRPGYVYRVIPLEFEGAAWGDLEFTVQASALGQPFAPIPVDRHDIQHGWVGLIGT